MSERRTSRASFVHAVALAGAVSFSAHPGVAAEPASPESLELQVRDCAPPRFEQQALHAALLLELGGARVRVRLNPTRAAPTEALLHVAIACEPRLSATVVLTATNDGSSTAREIALHDIAPADHARALALASAELLRARWPELAAPVQTSDVAPPPRAVPSRAGFDDAPESTPPDSAPMASQLAPAAAASAKPAPPSERSSAAPARDRGTAPERSGVSMRVAAAGVLRSLPEHGAAPLGAEAWFGVQRLLLGADLLLERDSHELGVASTGVVAGFGGYALPLRSASGSRLLLVPIGALGISWVSGKPARPGVAFGDARELYADLRARLLLEIELFTGAIPVLGVDVGYARGLAALANDEVVLATGGAFAGLTLGVAVPLAAHR